jgi:hypothetical protein
LKPSLSCLFLEKPQAMPPLSRWAPRCLDQCAFDDGLWDELEARSSSIMVKRLPVRSGNVGELRSTFARSGSGYWRNSLFAHHLEMTRSISRHSPVRPLRSEIILARSGSDWTSGANEALVSLSGGRRLADRLTGLTSPRWLRADRGVEAVAASAALTEGGSTCPT